MESTAVAPGRHRARRRIHYTGRLVDPAGYRRRAANPAFDANACEAYGYGLQIARVVRQWFPREWAPVAGLPLTLPRLAWLARGLLIWADDEVPLAYWVYDREGIAPFEWHHSESGRDALLAARLQEPDLSDDEAITVLCEGGIELSQPTPAHRGLGVQLITSYEETGDQPLHPLTLLIWQLLQGTGSEPAKPLEEGFLGDAYVPEDWPADRLKRLLRRMPALGRDIDLHATLAALPMQDGVPLGELILYAVGECDNPLCQISDGELVQVYNAQHDYSWDDWPKLKAWAAEAERIAHAWNLWQERVAQRPFAEARKLYQAVKAAAVPRETGKTLVQIVSSSDWMTSDDNPEDDETNALPAPAHPAARGWEAAYDHTTV